jgi:hypothetical protein
MVEENLILEDQVMVGGDAQMVDTVESAEDLAASPSQVTSLIFSQKL